MLRLVFKLHNRFQLGFINKSQLSLALVSSSFEIMNAIVKIHDLEVLSITIESHDSIDFHTVDWDVILFVCVLWIAFHDHNFSIFMENVIDEAFVILDHWHFFKMGLSSLLSIVIVINLVIFRVGVV
jgi:hypothetical protein